MQVKHHTGVVFGPDYTEWTVLRELKEGFEIAGQGRESRAAPTEDEPDPPYFMPEVKGVVHTVLPIGEALVRIMDLPSVDQTELAGMVELQIGKISPFPVEDLVVSFEVLDRGESTSRVLIAAARRELLEELRERGPEPRHIGLDMTAWWQGICSEGLRVEEGRALYVFTSPESTALIATENGVPIIMRSLLIRDGMAEDEYYAAIVEELHFSITAIEADWGGADLIEIKIFQVAAEGDEIAKHLGTDPHFAVETLPVDALGFLSELIAQRGMDRTGDCIDLVPPAWRRQGRDRAVRRKMLQASAVFGFAWLFVVVAIFGYTHWQKVSVQRQKEMAEQLQEPAKKSRALQMRIQGLEQYADRTRSVLECLREASVMLPSNLELISFSFKKEREVNLRGVSDTTSASSIYDYFQALETSGKFEMLKDQQVTTVTRRDVGRCSQFKVTLVLPGEEGEQI